jgi:hypothetical protein
MRAPQLARTQRAAPARRAGISVDNCVVSNIAQNQNRSRAVMTSRQMARRSAAQAGRHAGTVGLRSAGFAPAPRCDCPGDVVFKGTPRLQGRVWIIVPSRAQDAIDPATSIVRRLRAILNI